MNDEHIEEDKPISFEKAVDEMCEPLYDYERESMSAILESRLELNNYA